MGPPDVLAQYSGKNFRSEAFKSNFKMLHTQKRLIRVEASHSMSIVECYHAPLRRAFKIVKKNPSNLDEEYILLMAVNVVNDIFGPGDLIPTLVVFGALSRLGLPKDKLTPSTF